MIFHFFTYIKTEKKMATWYLGPKHSYSVIRKLILCASGYTNLLFLSGC